MARKGGFLKGMAKSCKRKATNCATQGLYRAMWNEEPPKGKKKVKSK